jgi:hypothetical protein
MQNEINAETDHLDRYVRFAGGDTGHGGGCDHEGGTDFRCDFGRERRYHRADYGADDCSAYDYKTQYAAPDDTAYYGTDNCADDGAAYDGAGPCACLY